MAKCIRRSTREILGDSREGSGRMKEAWWWSEEVKGKVKAKQEKYKALIDSKTEEEKDVNRVQYRIAKKDAKKAVAVAKNNAYEKLYQRLNSKKGENEVFKLARVRERRTRNLSSVRYINDDDGKVVVEDAKLQERWQTYFYKSSLMERGLTSSNKLRIWLKMSNKAPDPIVLSQKRRLRRH